ncbi:HlyD family secretion protein [Hymenobacter rigui]|uniref:HlyD family efflux transporter periplasmic adaptor subunit n=1 Tax=Hymenobacter rigui TaxID=334424 RepID=A0A428K9I6_9BACT|nr:HlyD family efflux transporter periplasmic adaptor subunit [Hymenobacter rigui]RSK43178.1 HlyD family efflux transporter periplasmic adaptor subunit [Hymenobacter rigui]
MPTATRFEEVRADEVQDLLARQPTWMLRWSITLLAGLLLAIFYGSWLIHFPDLVPATFTLTSVNAPKTVPSRSEGRLVRVLVRDGQAVGVGMPLGYMESTARPEEVTELSRELQQAWNLIRGGHLEQVAQLPLDRFHQLGELQVAYQPFALAHLQLRTTLTRGYFARRKALLRLELADLRAMGQNLTQQQSIQQEALSLATAEYAMHQRLAQQKVIAPLDLQREKTKLLSQRMPYRQTLAAVLSNSSAQRSKQQELLSLDLSLTEQRDQFLQALTTLQSATAQWERTFLLRSPIAGRVYFPLPLQDNQQVAAGQDLFYVAPGNTAYAGQMRIPQQSAGKVRVGQTVLIRFNGYPYQEFGLVRGTIQAVAQVPLQDGFVAQVRLPRELVTTRGQKLPYRVGMTASAEIITREQRLLQRLFQPIRAALSPAH